MTDKLCKHNPKILVPCLYNHKHKNTRTRIHISIYDFILSLFDDK